MLFLHIFIYLILATCRRLASSLGRLYYKLPYRYERSRIARLLRGSLRCESYLANLCREYSREHLP